MDVWRQPSGRHPCRRLLACSRVRDHGSYRSSGSLGHQCLEDQRCRPACVPGGSWRRGRCVMTEPMSREQVLAGIQEEIAEQETAARRETDPVKRMLRRARSREDYAEEEADAVAADIA